jgi:hypothetical protein
MHHLAHLVLEIHLPRQGRHFVNALTARYGPLCLHRLVLLCRCLMENVPRTRRLAEPAALRAVLWRLAVWTGSAHHRPVWTKPSDLRSHPAVCTDVHPALHPRSSHAVRRGGTIHGQHPITNNSPIRHHHHLVRRSNLAIRATNHHSIIHAHHTWLSGEPQPFGSAQAVLPHAHQRIGACSAGRHRRRRAASRRMGTLSGRRRAG